jgi:hypothetical protein
MAEVTIKQSNKSHNLCHSLHVIYHFTIYVKEGTKSSLKDTVLLKK